MVKRITKKTKTMKAVEREHGEVLEELLRHKFVDEGKSIRQIAREIKKQYKTTVYWLKKAGVYSRRLFF